VTHKPSGPEPSVDEHRKRALDNELLAKGDCLPPEWEVTVLFYAAVHWVRAFLKYQGLAQSFTSHRHVWGLLNSTEAGVDDKALEAYGELKDLSEQARYRCIPIKGPQVSFAWHCYERVKGFFEPKSR
jgi:hypothetical protein